MVRLRGGVPAALALAMLLSACFPPFDQFFPFPFGGSLPLPLDETLVIVNETAEDWVVNVEAEFGPTAYAVPADTSGEAFLFGGTASSVRLLDRDCTEVDELAWVDGAPLTIQESGSLSWSEEPRGDGGLETLIEFWECAGGLGAPPTEGDPLPEASGSIVVFGNDGSAWFLDVATGVLAAASKGDIFETEHALSPDGLQLAFTRIDDRELSSQLLVVPVGGGEARVLAENAGNPAWSPDGSRIAYLDLDPFAGGAALTVIELASGDVKRLTGNGSLPRWSPDGSLIAFISTDLGNFSTPEFLPGDLRVIGADGSGLRTLTETAPFATAPAWSPDGMLLAYQGPDEGPFDAESPMNVYDLVTDEIRTVARIDGSTLSEPSWSPDGRTIAFAVASFGLFATDGSVGIVAADGSGLEQLGTMADAYFSAPIWSPEGRWIAVTRSSGDSFISDLVAIEVLSGMETGLAADVMFASAWVPTQLPEQ